MKFTHFLITRFNVSTDYSIGTELDNTWLNHRCSLFENYCLPSVLAQVNKNFTWIILLNEKTPSLYITRIKKACLNGIPSFKILFVGLDFEQSIKDYFSSLPNRTEFLITSRLDNDDAIHKSFIHCIQELFNKQNYTFIEFINGYTYSLKNKTLRRRIFKGNPFATLIEKFSDSFTTVHCGPHLKLRSKGEFIVLETPVAWIQFIHENNRWNEESGELISENISLITKEFNFH